MTIGTTQNGTFGRRACPLVSEGRNSIITRLGALILVFALILGAIYLAIGLTAHATVAS